MARGPLTDRNNAIAGPADRTKTYPLNQDAATQVLATVTQLTNGMMIRYGIAQLISHYCMVIWYAVTSVTTHYCIAS